MRIAALRFALLATALAVPSPAQTVYEGTLDSITVSRSHTCGMNKSVTSSEKRPGTPTLTISHEARCSGSSVKLDMVATSEMKTAKGTGTAGNIQFEQGLWNSFRATALFTLPGGTTQLRMEMPARDLDPSSGFPVSNGTCKEITLTAGPIAAPAVDRTVTAEVAECSRNKSQMITKRDDGEYFVTWVEAHTLLLRPPDSSAESANLGVELTYAYRLNPLKTDLEVDHIEVVQAVQTADNKVPLIADKSTVARAFVRIKDRDRPAVSGVRGVLRGFRNGRQLPGSPIQPFDSAIASPAGPDREQLVHSLNFALPPSWTEEGEVVLAAEVNPDRIIQEEKYDNNSTETVVKFQPSRQLSIVYLEVCAGTPERCPTPAIREMASLTQKMYPVADGAVRYSPLGVSWHWRQGVVSGSSGETSLMAAIRKRYYLLETQQPGTADQLIAWVPPDLGATLGFSDPIWGGADESGHVALCTDTSASLLTMDPPPAVGPGSMRDPLDPVFTLSHELGHNFGLRHPNTADGCNARDSTSDWPFSSAAIGEVGFDTELRLVKPKSKFDLMSYCSPPANNIWISPFSFSKLYASRLEPALKVPPERAATGPMQFLIVSGWVSRDGASGGLDPAYRISSETPGPPSQPGSQHCLRFSSAAAEVGEYCFPVSFLDHRTGKEWQRADFTVKAPWREGATRVALVSGGAELAALTSADPPVLRVTSPQPGERWSGRRTLAWTGQDPAGQPLPYSVLYSADGGPWMTLDADIEQPRLEIDTARLNAGAEVRFRILATNGLSTTSTIAGPVELVPAARIVLWPETLDFGRVAVGASGTATVMVDNAGSKALAIGAVESSDAAVTLTGELAPELPPRTMRKLGARFQPRVVGEATGRLTFESDDESTPSVAIEWKGTGLGPKITLAPEALDFGEVSPGQNKTLSLTIANAGLAALTVSAVAANNARFSMISPAVPFTLEPETNAQVVIRFSPLTEGTQQGVLTVTSTDPVQPAVTVALAGRGSAGAPPQPRISISPSTLDFEEVAVGQSKSLNVTVTNSGTAPLLLSTAAASHASFTVTAGLPATLAPAASANVAVRFAPSAAGRLTAILEIGSNDPATPKATASLVGTGTVAPANAPKIEVSPVTVAFGTVTPQSLTTQPLQVRNSGGSALTVTSVTFADPRFSIIGLTVPITIQPRSSASWTVRFAAGETGGVSSSLTVVSNDPASPALRVGLTATVAGTALVPKIRVSRTSIDFGAVRVGSQGEETIEISNVGTAPLVVDSIRTDNDKFKVAAGGSFTLPVAVVYDLRVLFLPSSAKDEKGVLRIVSNDAGSPTEIVLTGSGR